MVAAEPRLADDREMSDRDPPADPSEQVPAHARLAQNLRDNLRPALVGVITLTVLTGGVFPLAAYALGNALFPAQAAGGLITSHGVVVGSRLIGQSFTRPEYFQPRPSAAGGGYDATSSGATNLAPSNPKLIAAVGEAARDYRKQNDLSPDAIVPIDAVTSSASGLDPHISPENAALQVARVARQRGLDPAVVRRLVADHTQGRQLGFMGAPSVSVLELNLALDSAAPLARR
jgi:potassium-transporting ATPase KdpC subunit